MRLPKGGWLAAAEAASEGAWWRLTSERLPEGEGRVEGVDFPDVACREARWDDDRALRVVLAPRHERLFGRPASFRVTGLADPDAWQVSGPDGVEARRSVADLIVETPMTTEEIRIHR